MVRIFAPQPGVLVDLHVAEGAERDRLWNLSQDMLARADYSGMMSAVSPAWTAARSSRRARLIPSAADGYSWRTRFIRVGETRRTSDGSRANSPKS